MPILNGNYKIKSDPYLPATMIFEEVNCLVVSNGYSTPIVGITVCPEGILYTGINEEGESADFLVYDGEFWEVAQVRVLYFENANVSTEFYNWITNNIQVPKEQDLITFTLNGKSFTAARGVQWVTWFRSQWLTDGFSTTPDDLVTYRNCGLRLNNKNVDINDVIVDKGNYSIPPQIRVFFEVDSNMEYDQGFAPRGEGGYLLTENSEYVCQFSLPTNYFAEPETVKINEYLTYETTGTSLRIKVGTITGIWLGLEPFNIRINLKRKLLLKLTDIVTGDPETTHFVEMAPPYRIEIDGPIALVEGGEMASTPINLPGKTVGGLIFEDAQLQQFGPLMGSDSFSSALYLPTLIPFQNSVVPWEKQMFCFGYSFVDLINQEIELEDLIGYPFVFLDGSDEGIINGYIAYVAKENGTTEEEVLAELESEAQELGKTLKEYVFSILEAQQLDIETLRVGTYRSITRSDLPAIEEIISNHLYFYETVTTSVNHGTYTSATFYFSKESNVITRIFTYVPITSSNVEVFNNGVPVSGDVVLSDENNFSLTVIQRDEGQEQLVINTTYPTSRYSPGYAKIGVQCLSGDTLITMGDGSKKRLDMIERGDIIKVSGGKTEKVIFTDSKAHKSKSKYEDYYFSNGEKVRVIKNHRIYSADRRKYIHFSDLLKGEKVMSENGLTTFLEKKVVEQTIYHYTLYSENSNGYYANGLLCGNFFSNIKNSLLRKVLLYGYYFMILKQEMQKYDKNNRTIS